jgi:hypothetical protein
MAGCERTDGSRCGYVDKRARACPTAWCPEHAAVLGGLVFCRRHASTLMAIDGAELVAGFPDLDNRAPSLVGWVGRELDTPVRELLTTLAAEAHAAVITEPVRLIITPGGRTRRWAMVWKTLDSTEVLTRVAVEVDEDDDCEVAARVDTELIGRGIPPWIEHRRRGEVVDPATDAAERLEFLGAMARSIELVVTKQEVVPGP